jgi:hypothetical protein
LEDEKALEEDAAKFDAFLKENDKNSVEAIKKWVSLSSVVHKFLFLELKPKPKQNSKKFKKSKS